MLVVALAYGWIAIGVFGTYLFRWRQRSTHPAVVAVVGTLLFSLAMDVLSLMSVVGAFIPLLMLVIGFSAVMLTRMGLRTYI